MSNIASCAYHFQPYQATNFEELVLLGRQEHSSMVNHALQELGGEELVRVFGVFPPLVVQEIVAEELYHGFCYAYENLVVEAVASRLASGKLRYAVRDKKDVELLMQFVGQTVNVDGKLHKIDAIAWYFITKWSIGDQVTVPVLDGSDHTLQSITNRVLMYRNQ